LGKVTATAGSLSASGFPVGASIDEHLGGILRRFVAI